MAYQTTNPYTNEVVKTYDNATADQIEQALATGHALYKQWRQEPVASRAATPTKLQLVCVNTKTNSLKSRRSTWVNY
ncbi:succinate-semialdehyde dehydrogenase [Lactiplantibacillus plantarum]|nr:succinate-semialdehyde dehydrogenase [Lactiplantibacillus plantarum]